MGERVPRVEPFDVALKEKSEPATSSPRRATPYVVGAANDPAEHRADQLAARGMAALLADDHPLPSFAPTTSTPGSRIRRSAASAEIGAAGGSVDDSLSGEIDAARGRGQRFEPHLQRSIQRATGHDVSDVRVHTDARADAMAQRIQASAFTVGRDVFFANGQYRPDTREGMHTVLHESAHAIDNGRRVQRSTIQRKVAATTDDLDQSFKHRTGLRGLAKSLSSDEIPKIRDALKRYHSAADGDPKQMAALLKLKELCSIWLAKHPAPKDRADQHRVDFIDSIAIQANLEYGKARAAEIYMGDARAAAAKSKASEGPGAHPLQNLKHMNAFTEYEKTREYAVGSRARTTRDAKVKKNELAPLDPAAEAELTAAIESLTPAELAAIHTYSGVDYQYINPNAGGWGVGDFDPGWTRAKKEGKLVDNGKKGKAKPTPVTDAERQLAEQETAAGKANKQRYEEAGLHAGFMAEAFRKLPIWRGKTYRGMAMGVDFLGLTTKGSYKANDFWSTSESLSVAQNFLTQGAAQSASPPTMAVLCEVAVTNGRDIARLSNVPSELEILLPPGSILNINTRQRLERGKDDALIIQHFGAKFFDSWKDIKEFWLIGLGQKFSGDKDVVGAY